jgi:hypothetical protein
VTAKGLGATTVRRRVLARVNTIRAIDDSRKVCAGTLTRLGGADSAHLSSSGLFVAANAHGENLACEMAASFFELLTTIGSHPSRRAIPLSCSTDVGLRIITAHDPFHENSQAVISASTVAVEEGLLITRDVRGSPSRHGFGVSVVI